MPSITSTLDIQLNESSDRVSEDLYNFNVWQHRRLSSLLSVDDSLLVKLSSNGEI